MYRVTIAALLLMMVGCYKEVELQSASGTKSIKVGKVQTNSEGETIEQHNIKKRIKMDNTPGAIKHLYVISAYSGQTLIYSTVQGKVTSSGKRLNPNRIDGIPYSDSNYTMPVVQLGDRKYTTSEVLAEDGTFGSSIEYLYWWDAKGVFHQHYVQGGTIVHIADQPIAVKSIILNMETSKGEGQ